MSLLLPSSLLRRHMSYLEYMFLGGRWPSHHGPLLRRSKNWADTRGRISRHGQIGAAAAALMNRRCLSASACWHWELAAKGPGGDSREPAHLLKEVGLICALPSEYLVFDLSLPAAILRFVLTATLAYRRQRGVCQEYISLTCHKSTAHRSLNEHTRGK